MPNSIKEGSVISRVSAKLQNDNLKDRFKNRVKNRQHYILPFLLTIAAISSLLFMIVRYFNYDSLLQQEQKKLSIKRVEQQQWVRKRASDLRKQQLQEKLMQNERILTLLEKLPEQIPNDIYLTDLTLASVADHINNPPSRRFRASLKGNFNSISTLQSWLHELKQLDFVDQLKVKSIQHTNISKIENPLNIEKENSFEFEFTLGEE